MRCFFVTDLHGRPARYRALFERIALERPAAVFLGGDLLPTHLGGQWERELGTDDFIRGFLKVEFSTLRETLGEAYPRVFLILGNDDLRSEEGAFRELAASGLWSYLHERREELGPHPVYGYACVPPTPFLLKDGSAMTSRVTWTRAASRPKTAGAPWRSTRTRCATARSGRTWSG